MPPLDLDHLSGAGAGGHGESMRETAPAAAQRASDVSSSARADDGDAPAESFLIPIRVRDGIGLAELLGAALRRDGSTKGSSNPKAAATTRAPRADSSRRSTATSKVVIGVVLPAAAGKVVPKERRAWRRPAAGGARVFASEAVGPEPVSPKVSCFGAVLPEMRVTAATAPRSTQEGEEVERGGGCWASVAAALHGLCCSCSSEPGEGEPDPKATAPEPPPGAVMSAPMRVAGLGDMKRLASRRWTETMAAEGRGSV